MCQLTFIRSKNKTVAKFLGYCLARTNSVQHGDGTGIWNFTSIATSKSAAHLIPNLAELISDIADTRMPFAIHVRKASYGKLVDKEHAHPFDEPELMLAHNGTLIPDNGVIPADKIDSQMFFKSLLDNYRQEPKFVSSFEKTIQDFSGKFAFIIAEKTTKTWYIIRGKTATLHTVPIVIWNNDKTAEIGYVVNTEKETLVTALNLAENYLRLLNINLFWDEKDITLLPMNSMWTAGEKLTLVEGTKFSEKEYFPKKYESTSYTQPSLPMRRGKGKSSASVLNLAGSASHIIETWAEFYNLDVSAVDLLFRYFLHTGILCAELTQIEFFANTVIPLLEKRVTLSREDANRLYTRLSGVGHTLKEHETYDLEFPYFMADNSKSDLINAIRNEESM